MGAKICALGEQMSDNKLSRGQRLLIVFTGLRNITDLFLGAFLISFIMVFIAELGDKTQLIVLSFSNTLRARTILFGVALGSLFSHGIAIIFGSSLGLLDDPFLRQLLEVITYISFILMQTQEDCQEFIK